MKVLRDIEVKIQRTIRDACAIDPLISTYDLQATLKKKFDRDFSLPYLRKMRIKVMRGALVNADRMQIEQRLGQTRENYRIVRERLLKIIYWSSENAVPGMKAPLPMDVIEACKAIVMMDFAMLKAEIENGLYRKPLEVHAKELYTEPLDPEVRGVIVASWKRFGLLPPAVVEEMVPAKVPEEMVPAQVV